VTTDDAASLGEGYPGCKDEDLPPNDECPEAGMYNGYCPGNETEEHGSATVTIDWPPIDTSELIP